VALLLLRTYQ